MTLTGFKHDVCQADFLEWHQWHALEACRRSNFLVLSLPDPSASRIEPDRLRPSGRENRRDRIEIDDVAFGEEPPDIRRRTRMWSEITERRMDHGRGRELWTGDERIGDQHRFVFKFDTTKDVPIGLSVRYRRPVRFSDFTGFACGSGCARSPAPAWRCNPEPPP